MLTQITTLETQLKTDNKVSSTPISAETLAATQWSTQSLCAVYMNTLPGLQGLAENVNNMNDLGMKFVLAPEFTDSTSFNVSQTEQILAQDISDPVSLLNPDTQIQRQTKKFNEMKQQMRNSLR